MGRNNDDRFWSVTRVLRTSTNNYHTCKIVVCKRNVSFTIFLPIYSSPIETVEHVLLLVSTHVARLSRWRDSDR